MRRSISIPALLLTLLGCNDDYILPAPEVSEDRVAAILSLPGDTEAGEVAFNQHCVMCHDVEGQEDGAGPALAPVVPERSERALLDAMLAGVGTMPAIDVTDQEAADLLAWMRANFEPDNDEVSD